MASAPVARQARDNSSALPIFLITSLWHSILAFFLVRLGVTILNADTLSIAGKAADLGRPVQVFAGSFLFVPALLGLIAIPLLFRRHRAGRYLALGFNLAVSVLSLFMLFGVWGMYGGFEAIVSGVMRAPYITLGFALAYLIYFIAGRQKGSGQRRIQRAGLIVGLLTLAALLISANIFSGIGAALASYSRPQAWGFTFAAVLSGILVLSLINLGATFGETPDGRAAWQGWFMLAPNVIGFLFFFAGPLLLSLYLSFTNSSVGQVPQVTGLSNYANLLALEFKTLGPDDALAQNELSFGYAVVREFKLGENRFVIGAKDRLFWISLWNTLLYCAMLIPLAILPALGMSLILNSSLPGMNFFRALYFLPSVAAVVGTALIWRWLYTPTTGFFSYTITQVTSALGLPDPKLEWLSDPKLVLISVVILAAWQVVGYNTVLFLAGLQGVPKSLYEAAQIDGASPWQRFRNVTLPLLAPTTFFVLITTMVTGLQAFNEPYALFPSRPVPEGATTLVYYLYTVGFNQFEFGYASAIAWALFIIIFGFTFIQFRANRSEAYGS